MATHLLKQHMSRVSRYSTDSSKKSAPIKKSKGHQALRKKEKKRMQMLNQLEIEAGPSTTRTDRGVKSMAELRMQVESKKKEDVYETNMWYLKKKAPPSDVINKVIKKQLERLKKQKLVPAEVKNKN